jgi:hypothetical protein
MPPDDLCPMPVQGGWLTVRSSAVEVKFRVQQRYVPVLHGAAVAELNALKAGQKTGQGSTDGVSADSALTGTWHENSLRLVKCDQGVEVMSIESICKPAVDVFRAEFRHRILRSRCDGGKTITEVLRERLDAIPVQICGSEWPPTPPYLVQTNTHLPPGT